MLFIEIDTKHGVHIVFERVVGYEYRQDGAKPVLVVYMQGDKEFRTADGEGITNFLQYVQKHNKAKRDQPADSWIITLVLHLMFWYEI